MEDEDEHALKGVEGGKEVSHNNCVFIDEEEAERPRHPQQEQQSNGPQSPWPVDSGKENVKKTESI